MGATFPIVLKARAKSLNELGRETGDVYSINNFGAIVGSFAAGFILIPLLGVASTNILAAALNLAVALIILYLSSSNKIWTAGLGWIIVLLSMLYLYIPYPSYIYSYYQANRYPSYESFQETRKWKRLVFEKEGAQGLMQVFKDTRDNSINLVNNGKIEGSAIRAGMEIEGGALDWTNQLLLAYLPLEARHGARSFLNIGL